MHKAICAAGLFLLTGCATPESGEALKSTFDTGVAAYDAGDYAKAYKIWSGIDDVDLAAMRNVAMMLRKGEGVAKNPKKAEELYEVAAEAGLPTAQADLADMLLKGEAGTPNPKAALPLLQAAAAANHPIAQFELGEMYEAGRDGLVAKDVNVARQLYISAASHGMKEAQDRLDQLAKADTGGTGAPSSQPAPQAPVTAQPASSTPQKPSQP